MAVVALGTTAVVKELQAAGFTEPQAEALTRAVRKAQDVDVSLLATKADLQVLKSDLQGLRGELDLFRVETKADIDALRQSTRADIDGLRQSTRTDMAELKADLMKWLVGTVGLQTIVILGTVAAMIRFLPR